MRICFITPEYANQTATGGIGNYVRDTTTALVEQGHQVTVICRLKDGAAYEEIDQGVRVYYVREKRLPLRPFFLALSWIPGLRFFKEIRCGWGLVETSLAIWLKAAHIVRVEKPFDLIHATDFSGIAFWGFLYPFRKAPIILRGHRFLDIKKEGGKWCGGLWQYYLETFCLRRADFILANSHYLRQRYIDELNLPVERLGCLTTAFAPHFIEPDHEDQFRQKRGWSEEHIILLFVGRIEHQKGCDLLFEAALQCYQQFPSLRLVMLGRVSESFELAYREFMENAAKWACHPGSVPADEVAKWMAAADIFVLPSRAETFGRVVAEAHLAGLPAIVTKVDALPESVTHGVNGLLVQEDDAQSLAEAVLTLCHDSELRSNMGKKARELALIRFDADKILTKQIKLYQALAKGQTYKQIASILED